VENQESIQSREFGEFPLVAVGSLYPPLFAACSGKIIAEPIRPTVKFVDRFDSTFWTPIVTCHSTACR